MGLMSSKIYQTFSDVISDITNGASVMMQSFIGPGGIPQNLILALKNRGVNGLDVYGAPILVIVEK